MEETKTMTEEAISYGFRKSKSYFGFFAAYLILIGIISLIFVGGATALAIAFWGEWAMLTALTPLVVFTPVAIVIGAMSLNISATVNRDEKPTFGALWPGFMKIVNFVIAGIIYAVVIGIGYLCLILPGIYLTIKYQFFGLAIMDKDVNALEAIKMSGDITRGNWGDCFWLVIEQGIVCLLGFLALGIGLFWAIPTALVSHGFAYTSLSSEVALALDARPVAAVGVAVPAE